MADLLEGERAFAFSARMLDARTLEAQFTVAPGYYLYRDKIQFSVEPGTLAKAPVLPPGTAKHDEFFGDVQTYRGTIKVRLPLAAAVSSEGVAIIAESQGCADLGVCYPPLRQHLTLTRSNVEPGPVVYAVPPKRTWFK